MWPVISWGERWLTLSVRAWSERARSSVSGVRQQTHCTVWVFIVKGIPPTLTHTLFCLLLLSWATKCVGWLSPWGKNEAWSRWARWPLIKQTCGQSGPVEFNSDNMVDAQFELRNEGGWAALETDWPWNTSVFIQPLLFSTRWEVDFFCHAKLNVTFSKAFIKHVQ